MSNNNSNNLKKEENRIPAETVSEEKFADEEHYKCVVKALQKAIDENEEVSKTLLKIYLINLNFKFSLEKIFFFS